MKVINIKTEEACTCAGCKGTNWILIQSNAKTYNKYICNNCGNPHTLYVYPPEYKHA